jgi:site-specific DNA-methyltransferase (adenine-specific)
MIPFPKKKYNIILADPPWKYNDRRNKHTRFCGGAMSHYDVMDLQDIKNLPIYTITDKDCMLFLWATFPNLSESLEVIKAWGFTYKTLGFSWIKLNKNDGKPFFGIGYYTKSNCEVCLIGVKGKPMVVDNSISSVLLYPRGEHSAKPSIVREKIVQLCGDVPRIELFARLPKDKLFEDPSYKGWDMWGNEV